MSSLSPHLQYACMIVCSVISGGAGSATAEPG
jgi:NAD-dependent oxidoreductase involved in siderophore biosynthesis